MRGFFWFAPIGLLLGQPLEKVVADAETKQILGAAILGVGGDEAIHGILDMMNAGATYPVLQWAVL